MNDTNRSIIRTRAVVSVMLIFYICLLDVPAVIAFILCWAGASGDKKRLLRISGVLFYAGAVWLAAAGIYAAVMSSGVSDQTQKFYVAAFALPLAAGIISAVVTAVCAHSLIKSAKQIPADKRFFD